VCVVQNDTKKLAEAKQLVYLRGFTDGVLVVRRPPLAPALAPALRLRAASPAGMLPPRAARPGCRRGQGAARLGCQRGQPRPRTDIAA
jgi:hypothetical protein